MLKSQAADVQRQSIHQVGLRVAVPTRLTQDTGTDPAPGWQLSPFEPLSDLVISIFHSALTSLLSRGERGIAAPTQLWNKHFFVLTTQGSVQTWRLCRAGLHTQSPRTDKRKREKGTVTCPCLGSLRLPEILLTPSTRLPGKRNLIHLIHRLCPLALRGNYT